MPPKKDKGKATADDATSKISTKPIKKWSDMVDEEQQHQNTQLQIQQWLDDMQATNPQFQLQPQNINPQVLQLLQTISQNLTQTPTQQPIISQPTPQLQITPSSPSSSKQKSEYKDKTSYQNIITIEDSFPTLNPDNPTPFFPPGWYFKPHDITKNQKYYMTILEHSGSCIFKHFNFNKGNDPAYSTCHILRVLHPRHWGQDLHKAKQFPISSTQRQPDFCPYYSYWDYQQAWFNTFLIQNKKMSHSWLIYFDTKTNMEEMPLWFLQWWDYYGSMIEILKPTVQESYTTFKTFYRPTPKESKFPKLLLFCSKFYLPWICAWHYEWSKPKDVVILTRRFQVKWWDTFTIPPSLSNSSIETWLRKNNHSAHPSLQPHNTFLAQKSHLQSRLAGAKTQEEYFELMQKFVQEHQSTTASSGSSNESIIRLGDGDENEDDCFGILPPPKP